jgi:hypothetical protein
MVCGPVLIFIIFLYLSFPRGQPTAQVATLLAVLRIQTLLIRIRILLFTMILIRILLFNLIRIRIRLFDMVPDPYHFKKLIYLKQYFLYIFT